MLKKIEIKTCDFCGVEFKKDQYINLGTYEHFKRTHYAGTVYAVLSFGKVPGKHGRVDMCENCAEKMSKFMHSLCTEEGRIANQ